MKKSLKCVSAGHQERMYDHVFCECGGLIGDYKKGIGLECYVCRRKYKLEDINYDIVMTNDYTGWVFPMKSKGV